MNLTPSSPQDAATVMPFGASEESSRIFTLDVLRGIALLGILFISIWEFGGFSSAQQNFYRTGTHGGNYTLLNTVSVLLESKMTALFALVFGAGIVLFMQKKHPVPIGTPDAFIRRQLWLLLFGVFNAFIFLWPGDILYPLAVTGILLFAFGNYKGAMVLMMILSIIAIPRFFFLNVDTSPNR